MKTQEVSMIPQLDGPGSLPVRDHTRGRVVRFLGQIEQDSSQGGTYVQRAPTTRRREYPGGDSDNDGYRGPHQDQRPPGRGRYPGARPPTEENTLAEDPLEEDILMEVEDPLAEEDTQVEDP